MKESDIRDRRVLNTYLGMVEEDCKFFFQNTGLLREISCPACDSDSLIDEFVKSGFVYASCHDCHTLFVRNRPTFQPLIDFYARSKSTSFWVKYFFKPKEENRRVMIFQPRAQYIVDSFGKDPGWMVGDIGAGFGIFLEELKKKWPRSNYIAVEPSEEQAEICGNKGLIAQCCPFEDLKGHEETFDLLTAFELVEHLWNPRSFFQTVYKNLKPGGFFYATMLNGQGYDIQVLWQQSKSIFPPHHLNFFNPNSLTTLLTSCGFTVLQLDTPGRLDWDIVEGMIAEEGASTERFWKMMSERVTAAGKRDFQAWLSDNKLSSHMRVFARK